MRVAGSLCRAWVGRTWIALLVLSCGSTVRHAGEGAHALHPHEASESLAAESMATREDTAPRAAFAPFTPPAAALDTLPIVREWMEEARRCSRFGARRFCDGPRRAPRPQGPAAQLAARIGLGSFHAAAELIRGRPEPAWVQATEELGLRSPRELVWPIDGGRYGRGLQWRGRRIRHRGVDITTEVGTPVRALADGVVGYANNGVHGYGNLLVMLHGGGEVSAYAHLSAIHASPGQLVRAGQIVALSGNTGLSRGPHLHFEWREAGQVRDPMPRFPEAARPRWMR